MGSIGTPEIIVILVLALIVLGPDRLPEAARTAGKWFGELKRMTASVQAEVQDVVDEVMRPVQEAASMATGSSTARWDDVPDVVAPDDSGTGVTSEAAVEVTAEPEPFVDPSAPPPFDPSLN